MNAAARPADFRAAFSASVRVGWAGWAVGDRPSWADAMIVVRWLTPAPPRPNGR